MVHYDHMLSFFALAERKKRQTRKEEVPLCRRLGRRADARPGGSRCAPRLGARRSSRAPAAFAEDVREPAAAGTLYPRSGKTGPRRGREPQDRTAPGADRIDRGDARQRMRGARSRARDARRAADGRISPLFHRPCRARHAARLPRGVARAGDDRGVEKARGTRGLAFARRASARGALRPGVPEIGRAQFREAAASPGPARSRRGRRSVRASCRRRG